MLSSFESVDFAEAFTLCVMGAVSRRRHGEPSAVPPESLEHVQTGHRGLAGTWEVLSILRFRKAYGVAEQRRNTPGLRSWPSGAARSEDSGAIAVPPNEGNEVRRDDRQEVLVPS